MLGKILLTLAVIGIAFFIVRQRAVAEKAQQQRNSGKRPPPAEISKEDDTFEKDIRLGAYLFLVLMVGLGATLYYYQWQDDHEIVTVTLHRDNLTAPVSYEVYKYQLGERSFTTVGGTSVTVASSERMVVVGLDK